ncbi:conserved hypothetical protein [Shewanella halifaxensis HAW-EB4]|uniref:DUF2489 domain-containing protein n=1 Tax=Shewanella halifaxensis (strain HAW-EB4) TaxID=458817 RepID=B0TNN3_SHEHH|nr:DUF2489 domain-containing protein [Shewanella halifaxensis]ABZ78765.1 conserved hypothetical protein [Shewanella halifaxensis HAW-EB4]
MTTAFIVLGVIIIAALSAYATYLLIQVRKQKLLKLKHKQEQADAAKAKANELLDNIRYIANAMVEERCELSEGVMRIVKLSQLVGISELVANHYPATFEHFEVIKEHPIKDQRKALEKQERMKLDFARMRSESELEAKILEEAKRLSELKLGPLH